MTNPVCLTGTNNDNIKPNKRLSNNFATTNFGNVQGEQNKNSNDDSKVKIARNITLAFAGLCIGILGVVKFKLGKALNLLGEEKPISIGARLNKMVELASKDGMTKLFNKKTMVADLPKMFNKSLKDGQPFSAGMIDMDNFKSINEVFSHKDGDTFLKRIAANIIEISKKYNAKGYRYGGEELVVLMPGKNSQEAQKIMNEIADSIKKDEVIQSYIPKFKERANEDIGFITGELKKFDSLLPHLRKNEFVSDTSQINENICSLINSYKAKYKPSDTSVLDEITNKLKSTEASGFLRGQAKLSNGNTLGEELNKIYFQYKSLNNDLQKWMGHIERHGLFTTSGGVFTVDNSSAVKDSGKVIEIVDSALKTAKESGKNTIVVANNNIINRVINN